MGLFDQLLTLAAGDKMNQFQSVITWVEDQGNIQGLVEKFNQQGFGTLIQSWISNQENAPISVDQLVQIFSSANIQQLADKVGFDLTETSALIAKYLPKLINKATPDGEIPADVDLATVGMNMLKEKLFG